MVLNGGTVTIALENMDIDTISILLSHLVAEIWVKECFSLMAATKWRLQPSEGGAFLKLARI